MAPTRGHMTMKDAFYSLISKISLPNMLRNETAILSVSVIFFIYSKDDGASPIHMVGLRPFSSLGQLGYWPNRMEEFRKRI